MKTLVTGGAGFIGSHIVRALLKEREEVVVLDNFSTGFLDNLEEVKHRIELVDGDIRKPEHLKKAMKGVQVVFHQAALPSVPRSMKDPVATSEINVGGTLSVLEAARQAKVRRVVFASSSSVYGESPDPFRQEEMPLKPMSPYALAKQIGEQYCSLYSRVFGVETVALRYFNVFGPRQNPNSQYAAVVPSFITQLLDGRAPAIYGTGKQSRDFTFVENVVQANLLAARVPGVSGQVFNVGSGGTLTVNELFHHLADLLSTDLSPVYEPARQGDVQHSQADISLGALLLGYTPAVDFQEGLRRTVDWYRQAKGSVPAAAPPLEPALSAGG